MTRDQVRKVLASRPDSVTRIISAGQLNEVWIYKPNMARGWPFIFSAALMGTTCGR